MNKVWTLALLLACATGAAAAPAPSDPAAVVGAFNASLLATMKEGKGLGLSGRTAKLLPLVKATHDMPAMTRLVAGPAWATTAPADKTALTDAFTRHSVVAYATNFASFDGQRFTVQPKVDMRGEDALVHAAIVAKDGTTPLNYRLHKTDGGWRIVDVYADGISQIAVQRAEFAGTIKAGGAAALAAKLNAGDEAKLAK
ncbi:ABC transporter substrate-binding protein [Polymorphobacter sp. PAMC 29334]|uniref:ABC transporter substrate-binding protein n=1 Tax=Polymorphobacter sp. PAMC 29334 TaxID=2862331 RepID=UPI001C7500FA|nr:ABC transporter substrate-binding protein [Polymorphobacter sp. PAMC 29334]QYE34545.1 ABC transporter substrate-binding protein [Polymorphobacter sp. PAMC 29334]